MVPLRKGYAAGTHRLISPEETWGRISPHFAAIGITRCAVVTGLDRLGVPVSCAVRPDGRLLQVSNGKGLRQVDANVSACMEAIELQHAEHRACPVERRSLNAMLADGRMVLQPSLLPKVRPRIYFSGDYVLDWVKGEELSSKAQVWIPASAAYWCTPFIFDWSSNGLASGNHLIEATLHGLYEVIERDTVASLSVGARVTFAPRRCRFINPATIPDGPLKELCERLSAAEIKLVLIWIKNRFSVHTFIAVLLDRRPFALSSTVNVGYGAHLSPAVAAVRSITEAAQSRLTFIHGAREDMTMSAYEKRHEMLYRFFDGVAARGRWSTLVDWTSVDLLQDYNQVVRRLVRAGYQQIFRVNMTRPPYQIPVVKMFVPGMRLNESLA